jgi:hypothetical protein
VPHNSTLLSMDNLFYCCQHLPVHVLGDSETFPSMDRVFENTMSQSPALLLETDIMALMMSSCGVVYIRIRYVPVMGAPHGKLL